MNKVTDFLKKEFINEIYGGIMFSEFLKDDYMKVLSETSKDKTVDEKKQRDDLKNAKTFKEQVEIISKVVESGEDDSYVTGFNVDSKSENVDREVVKYLIAVLNSKYDFLEFSRCSSVPPIYSGIMWKLKVNRITQEKYIFNIPHNKQYVYDTFTKTLYKNKKGKITNEDKENHIFIFNVKSKKEMKLKIENLTELLNTKNEIEINEYGRFVDHFKIDREEDYCYDIRFF